MTIYELHIRLEDGVDKQHGFTTPEFSHEQRDRALNIATERFVKQRYGGNNVKKTGFEETQKRTDDLWNLVEYVSITSGTSGFIQTDKVSTKFFILPEDYWFSIYESINYTNEACNITGFAGVKARRHNEINTILKDPFNLPENDDCFRVIQKGKLQLFYDKNITVTEYKLGYIQKFQKLEVGVTYITTNPTDLNDWRVKKFWMNDETHQEIIEIAVKYLLESVGDPRYNTSSQEILSTE